MGSGAFWQTKAFAQRVSRTRTVPSDFVAPAPRRDGNVLNAITLIPLVQTAIGQLPAVQPPDGGPFVNGGLVMANYDTDNA